MSSQITINTNVEIDLDSYEDEFKDYFCDSCYESRFNKKQEIIDYIEEMRNNLYIYSQSSRKIKTMEEIFNDLDRIIRG